MREGDKLLQDKEWLFTALWVEEKTVSEISKICKCSANKVTKMAKKYGIKILQRNELSKIRKIRRRYARK